VLTATLRKSYEVALMAVSQKWPVLLYGPVGAGKTALINKLAQMGGNRGIYIHVHNMLAKRIPEVCLIIKVYRLIGYGIIRIRSVAYHIVLLNCVVKHCSTMFLLVSEVKSASYLNLHTPEKHA
jgi:midasin